MVLAFFDGEKYEFGNADYHLLRAYYMIATGSDVIPDEGYPQFDDVLDKIRNDDPHLLFPPWKNR